MGKQGLLVYMGCCLLENDNVYSNVIFVSTLRNVVYTLSVNIAIAH